MGPMLRTSRLDRLAGAAGLLLALAIAAAVPLRAQTAVEPACLQVEADYAAERDRLNARTLSFLLFDAAENGCAALVDRLLTEGASIKARNRIGNTALILSSRMGHVEVADLLLKRGAVIDQANLNGVTPLLAAATRGREQAVKFLLAAGADQTLADNRGVTPLIAAAFEGHESIARILIDSGADTQRVDETGKGALVYAAGHGSAAL